MEFLDRPHDGKTLDSRVQVVFSRQLSATCSHHSREKFPLYVSAPIPVYKDVSVHKDDLSSRSLVKAHSYASAPWSLSLLRMGEGSSLSRKMRQVLGVRMKASERM